MLTARLFLTSAILLASSTTFAAVESTYDFVQTRDWTTGSLYFDGGAGTIEVNAENDSAGTIPAWIRADGTDPNLHQGDGYGLVVCSVTSSTPTVSNSANCGSTDYSNPEDLHYVDSIDSKESVVLTFTQDVILSSADFKFFNGGFDLWVDGTETLVGEALQNTVAFTGIAGSQFAFHAGSNERDYFKMTSLTVAEVPIPAAAWLFGSGLIGLATIARKRKLTS